jgi:hypothetical protein
MIVTSAMIGLSVAFAPVPSVMHPQNSQKQIVEFFGHVFRALSAHNGLIATAAKTVKHDHRSPIFIINSPSPCLCAITD